MGGGRCFVVLGGLEGICPFLEDFFVPPWQSMCAPHHCNLLPRPFLLLSQKLDLPFPSIQTLAGFTDVEHFCEMVDALEEQGMESCMFVSGCSRVHGCLNVGTTHYSILVLRVMGEQLHHGVFYSLELYIHFLSPTVSPKEEEKPRPSERNSSVRGMYVFSLLCGALSNTVFLAKWTLLNACMFPSTGDDWSGVHCGVRRGGRVSGV